MFIGSYPTKLLNKLINNSISPIIICNNYFSTLNFVHNTRRVNCITQNILSIVYIYIKIII